MLVVNVDLKLVKEEIDPFKLKTTFTLYGLTGFETDHNPSRNWKR